MPEGAAVDDVYEVIAGTDVAESAVVRFTIVSDTEAPYVTIEDIEDKKLGETFTVRGTTNLEKLTVIVSKDGVNKHAAAYTKAEYEAGITLELPEGAAVDDVYEVIAGTDEVESAVVTFTIIDDEVTPSGTLALAGGTTRSVKVGDTLDITTTPQNWKPEDATVEVKWTIEDETIVQLNELNEAYNNIATFEKLKKGTTKVTATLYVNGVEVDSKVITIKDKSTSTSTSTSSREVVNVKVGETVEIDTPSKADKVEFIPTSGKGEVKVEIVDGKIVVTGVTEGNVVGEVKVTDANGRVISRNDYKFVVTKGDVVVTEHECEWPDIAATATSDAHWAHKTIDAMTINGYINGYPDGLFRPDDHITRAEFSAIVYRILGLEEAEDGVEYDDTKTHWAEGIIATMSLPEGYGMLRGYGNGNFGPEDNITREQAVAIIARAKSSVWKEATEGAREVFADADKISKHFYGEMDAAVTNGLIKGYADGTYRPLEFTTRAEACELLARAWPEILE